jgi:hypothetical protein
MMNWLAAERKPTFTCCGLVPMRIIVVVSIAVRRQGICPMLNAHIPASFYPIFSDGRCRKLRMANSLQTMERLKYATLALVSVNISVGGALT